MGARKSALPSARAVRRRLLDWYETHRRDLPWRRTGQTTSWQACEPGGPADGERPSAVRGADPYRIWVAEVMLVQTQVRTAIPYYQRFVQRFPDIHTLAAADLDEVLKTWEGLGYYARARNLHKTARIVVDRYSGHLPSNSRALRELPGIGAYLDAAIRSLAFGQAALAIDANVRRVLSRLYDLERPRDAGLRRHGEPLVATGSGDVNQALMDLGSSICKPRSPECGACPLESLCLARARGTANERPGRRLRRERPHYDIAAGVIWRDGRILIAKRPEEGLLGGLWEFPGGKAEPGESLEAAVVREVLEELAVRIEPEGEIAAVDHAYSHFEITLHAFHCRYRSGTPRPLGCQQFAWVRPEELEGYAFPAANHPILRHIASSARRS